VTSRAARYESCAVYRAYDRDGNPLYYGSSANPYQRLATHASTDNGRCWTPQVARIDLDWFDSRTAALAHERAMTLRDGPWYSRQGVTVPWGPPKPPTLTPGALPVPSARGATFHPRAPLPPTVDYERAVVSALRHLTSADPTGRFARALVIRRARSRLRKADRIGSTVPLAAALDRLTVDNVHPVTCQPVTPADPTAPIGLTYRWDGPPGIDGLPNRLATAQA